MKPIVAQMCLTNSWGGLEMSTLKWAKQFAQHGHISVGVCRKNSPIAEQFSQLKFPNCQIEPGKYFSPLASRKIGKFLDQQKVQILFLHNLRDLWIAYPALIRRPHIRLFGFARMFIRDVNKKDFLHKLIYSRMEKLITLSQIQKSYLLNCLPLREDQYVVIPNGIDTNYFQPQSSQLEVRKSLGASPGETLIGLIGRLDRQKGQIEFIEAAFQISRKHPNTKFVLIGAETAGESGISQEINKLIHRYGLEQQVRLTDFRKDVPEVMNALDIFVMPSYEENFGNVLLEAMASGRPCIGTNSGGTPEIIDHGRTGLLVEPKSATSLAQGLEKLLSDPSWAASLGKSARRKAVETYDLESVFQRVNALI